MRDPYFERFFGIPNIQLPRSSIEKRQGSGVIFSSKGLVITNAHVVAPGAHHTIELAWAHGRKMPAEVVALCYDRDIALLKLSRDYQRVSTIFADQ